MIPASPTVGAPAAPGASPQPDYSALIQQLIARMQASGLRPNPGMADGSGMISEGLAPGFPRPVDQGFGPGAHSNFLQLLPGQHLPGQGGQIPGLATATHNVPLWIQHHPAAMAGRANIPGWVTQGLTKMLSGGLARGMAHPTDPRAVLRQALNLRKRQSESGPVPGGPLPGGPIHPGPVNY